MSHIPSAHLKPHWRYLTQLANHWRLRVPTLGVGHRGLAIARAPPAPCREREQAAGLKLLEQIEALAGLQPAVISLPVEKPTDGSRHVRTAPPCPSNAGLTDHLKC